MSGRLVLHPGRFTKGAIASVAACAIFAGCALLGPWPDSGQSPVPVAPSNAPASFDTIAIETRDLAFVPTALTMTASGTSLILVHNAGRVVHNLTVDTIGVQVVVSPGGTGETTIAGAVPGEYEFYCSVSGHREAGMVGTLTVR